MANTIKLGNGNWATKEGSLLAYNDENNNFKPLPFTTTRASSATVVNKQGLIETVGSGIPRIDFSDDANGALLLEPTRSNLIAQSNQFDTTWISVNVTLNSNQTGVGGSNDAWEATSTSGVDYLRYNSNNWLGDTTFSVYAKAGTLNSILMTGFGNTYFNLETGVVGTSSADSAKMESMGNGWYRCSVVGNTGPSQVRLYPSDSENANAIGSIYIQNSQVEQGSYATSYIPTQGGVVTRNQDSCSQTVPSGVIGQTEGVIYAEINISSIESVGVYSGWKIDGTSGNQIAFIIYPNGRIQSTVFDGGSLVVNINDNNYGLTSGTHKIALAYKQNDYILYIDGSVVGSATSATVPIVNNFNVSYLNGGSLKYNQSKLYNTRLSNAELQALTT